MLVQRFIKKHMDLLIRPPSFSIAFFLKKKEDFRYIWSMK